MARSARFLWSKGPGETGGFEGTSLTIGSRLPSELVLDDPIAAARHAVVHFTGQEFQLEALPSATGTYVNGRRLEGLGPLVVGDRLVLGASRIEVQALDTAAPSLSLAVSERSFFFVAKTTGEFQSDTDEWVRSEVRFGRMPRLRIANLAVAALGLLLLVIAWSTSGGEALLSPGPLSAVHHQVFDADEDELPALALASGIPLARLTEARAAGCASCHAPEGGIAPERCIACHTDLGASFDGPPAHAPARHPFVLGERTACADCHREHAGGERPVAADLPAAVACSDCHGDEFPDGEAGVASVPAAYGLSSGGASRARRVGLGFEDFHHGAHREFECSQCHVAAEEGRRTDFTAPSFSSCASCHGSGGVAYDGRGPATELTWHGSGQGRCDACHTEAYAADLARVERTGTSAAAFRLAGRSHADLFHLELEGRACSDCHIAGANVGASLAARAFRHESHLSPDASPAELAAQCAECHTDMTSATALAAAPLTYNGPSTESCVTCHGTAPVLASAVATPLPASAGAASAATRAPADALPRWTPVFDHAAHAGVEGGCLTCHTPTADTPSGIATPAHASDCRRCHIAEQPNGGLVHVAIGPGSTGCTTCHRPTTPGRLADVFYGPRDTSPLRSALAGFSHHTPGHAESACTDCHGTLDHATAEVTIPTALEARCTACHAQTRFHWR